MSGFRVTLDERRLRARLAAFTRAMGPEVRDVVVRKTAFDVVAETTRGLNGVAGLPKRIDTGRLRAGWRIAAEAAALPSLPGAAASTDPGNPSQPGDGLAQERRSGGALVLTVGNAVAYARHVEFGTRRMRPGLHLQRGLRLAARNLPPTAAEAMRRAWRGR